MKLGTHFLPRFETDEVQFVHASSGTTHAQKWPKKKREFNNSPNLYANARLKYIWIKLIDEPPATVSIARILSSLRTPGIGKSCYVQTNHLLQNNILARLRFYPRSYGKPRIKNQSRYVAVSASMCILLPGSKETCRSQLEATPYEIWILKSPSARRTDVRISS